MGLYEDNYLANRPQSLCKMCGKCCRVATSSVPYEQICALAKNGDRYAKEFLSIFVPYDSIEDARNVHAEIVDNIINLKSADIDFRKDELTFYYCKYIGEDNLCKNYENRPTLCKHCPSTPWSIVPPGCGFEGWLFWKREEDKQRVRKYKEELLELELFRKKTTDIETLKKIDAVKHKLHRNIDFYKKYGSENW